MPEKGMPMFPPVRNSRSSSFKISPTKVTVVVLPLDPVMPMIVESVSQNATSISEKAGIPKSWAWPSMGTSSGTPGLSTMKSWPSTTFEVCPPVSKSMPSALSLPIWSESSSSGLASDTNTFAPIFLKSFAQAKPDLAIPRMEICFPMILSFLMWVSQRR